MRKMFFVHVIWILLLSGTTLSAQQAEEFPTNPYAITAQSLVEQLKGGLGIVDPSQGRQLAPVALNLIKYFEKWIPDLYNDPVGYCTIGYGHLIGLRKCQSSDRTKFPKALELAEGLSLLATDVSTARIAVEDYVVEGIELNDEQFGALASFAFNVGSGNFRNSTLLRLLNAGDYEAAAEQFPLWIKGGGRILPGLVTRRACEQALFSGILRYDDQGEFNVVNCDSLGIAGDAKLIDILVGEE